eukprot:2334089-Pyramimonas_sp.AAC.1
MPTCERTVAGHQPQRWRATGTRACATPLRDETIDLVVLADWSASEVVVETCVQGLFDFGPTGKHILDLPAAVNAAYHQ